jgi:hypothetical protein
MHKMPPTKSIQAWKTQQDQPNSDIKRADSSKAKYEKSTLASFSGIPRQKEKVGHPTTKTTHTNVDTGMTSHNWASK